MMAMSDGAAQNSSSIRTYGGVAGAQRTAERRERLMAAGLELLGAAEEPGLTVRGVCKESGLIARYFYENFDDVDALAVAVHERVIDDLVTHTLSHLANAGDDSDEHLRLAISAIVDHLAEDPRRGRILFLAPLAMPALMARRPQIVTMFAGLVRAEASGYVDLPDDTADIAARFLVGGFGEVLTAWQDGSLDVTRETVVERCFMMFRGIVEALAPQR